MKNVYYVKLNDVCELITDGTHQTPTYSESGYIFLSSKNVTNGIIDWENIKYIPEELHKKLYERISPKVGDILLAKNGTTGIAALVDKNIIFDIYVSLALLRPKKNILSEYLLWAINNPYTKRKFQANLKGIGVPNLHLSSIKKTEIKFYDMTQQIYISNIMKKCKRIIDLKKQQLSELDRLVKFQFLKIFGDPILNEKNWKKIFLSDCCIINPKKNEIKLDDNFSLSFIGMADVSEKGKINTSNIKLYKKVKNGFTYFKENDVLFAKITPCMENGKGGIAKNLYNKIGFGSTEFHVLRPIENISNSYWLYYLTMLPFFRKNAEKNMTGSAGQKRVPVTYFQKTLIALPPIELQNKFADFVKQVDKSKVILGKALKSLSFGLNYYYML